MKADGIPGRHLNRKPVTLALQGGGSHGAFTWGVLDRLLEDARVEKQIDFERLRRDCRLDLFTSAQRAT